MWVKSEDKNPPIGNETYYVGDVMSLSSTSLSDMGYYFCYGRSSNSNNYFVARAQLKVYGKCMVKAGHDQFMFHILKR